MSTVTRHFGIVGRVPFLDVNVDSDNPLFFDPLALQLEASPQPFAAQASQCIDSFFAEVRRCVLSTDPMDKVRGLALLQQFREPRVSRLGMSAKGFDGRGVAEKMGDAIWRVLSGDANALVRVGFLGRLDELPAFVEGIDKDFMSDIATRLAFGPLAEFTTSMVARYPALAREGIAAHDHQRWDPSTLSWCRGAVGLPVANGFPLLLIPRNWARPGLLMSSLRYYSTALLSYEQARRATRDPVTNRVVCPRKDFLRTLPDLTPGRDTNLRVTVEAMEEGTNLIGAFRRFADERYTIPSEECVRRRTAA